MNQLRVKNKTVQNNQAQIKSLQFQTMPNDENNNRKKSLILPIIHT